MAQGERGEWDIVEDRRDEAEAERRRLEAEGDAAAIYAKLEAEARGQYEILAKKGEGLKQMAEWIKEGKVKYREDVVQGLENTPKAFMRMLNGENKGKQLVKV